MACFDGNLTGVFDGLVIRADLLKQFLQENDLMIFWACLGEKQYFYGDHNQKWSKWTGCFYPEGNEISGHMIKHGSI